MKTNTHATFHFRFAMIAAALMIFGAAGLGGTSAHAQTGWSYITLSPYYVVPGETFTVSGNGFMSGERVTIEAFGRKMTATANGNGQFVSSSMTVPYSAITSTEVVSARGSDGDSGTATLSIGGFYPNVEPSSYYIVPGNTVRFSGTNFAPGERVEVSRNGDDLAAVSSDSAGSFTTGNFAVGFEAGPQTYRFTGLTSGVSVERSITVSGAPPYILLTSYYNTPGSNLRVTGNAFGSREEVTVDFAGIRIGTSTTDRNGSFTLDTKIPLNAAVGKNTVVARGRSTGISADALFTVARALPMISFFPSSTSSFSGFFQGWKF